MNTENLLPDAELETLVRRVWDEKRDTILKQVEYAVADEFSQRARARARQLAAREVDAILRPKIEALREAMEARAKTVADGMLARLEDAMRTGLEAAIGDISEHLVRETLSRAEYRIRTTLLDALKAKDPRND